MQQTENAPLASTFTSYDGCRVQVYRWGRAGPPCIFLHGFGEGSYVWDDFASSIVPPYQSIAIDLRGHGDSDWDASRPHDFSSYVKDVAGLIDALRLTRVCIVGHSLGGRIATHIAASRAHQVFALILVESAPDLRRNGIARMRSDFKDGHRIYASVEDHLAWLEQRRTLVPRETLRNFARRSLRRRPDGAFELKFDPSLIDEQDDDDADAALWRAIREVRCPALVLRGIGSSVFGRDLATRVAEAFSHGRLHTIDQAGHGLIAENPRAFADVAREFLDQSAVAYDL